MKYTEEKATEIAEKFNISSATMRVWKCRGKIPSRYLQETPPEIKEKSSRADTVMQNRIIEILSIDFVIAIVILNLANVRFSAYSDAKRGKAVFSPNEMKRIKIEILKLKTEITNAVNSNSTAELRKITRHKGFWIRSLVHAAGGDRVNYARISRFSRCKQELDDIDRNFLKEALAYAAVRLSI